MLVLYVAAFTQSVDRLVYLVIFICKHLLLTCIQRCTVLTVHRTLYHLVNMSHRYTCTRQSRARPTHVRHRLMTLSVTTVKPDKYPL